MTNNEAKNFLKMESDFDLVKNAEEFFPWIKEESEKIWKRTDINKAISGFQIQRGTKWLLGLTDDEIVDFEKELGFCFPAIYKSYLRYMNGTDKEMINVFGGSEVSPKFSIGFYSYPRDIKIIKDKISWICKSFNISPSEIGDKELPHIMPIVSHRFLIMDQCPTNPVLSMFGDDVILYADSLPNFLYYDIFYNSTSQLDLKYEKVKFWLD